MADWDQRLTEKEANAGFFLNGMKNLWFLLGTERSKFGVVILLTMVTEALAIGFPYILKMIFDVFPKLEIDQALVVTENYSNNQELLGYLFILFGIAFAIKVLANITRHLIKEPRFIRSWIKLENYWPVAAQEKLLDLSFGYHELENTGKKIAKIDNGSIKLSDMLGDLYWNFLPQLFFFVFNVVVIFIIDWRLGGVFLGLFIPGIMINMNVNNRTTVLWEEWEKKRDIGSGYFVQSLLNLNTVQSFVQEKRETKRLATVRQDMESLDWSIHSKYMLYWFSVGMFFNIGYFATVVLSLYFVFNGTGTIGTAVYIATTGLVTIDSVYGMMHNYTNLIRRMVTVNRMKELFDTEIDIVNKSPGQKIACLKGTIDLENITFTYPGKDEPVLRDLSLQFDAQKMIALVSRSGEGKTTISRLLTRMYDVEIGKIKLDGTDIKDFDLFWYRSLFAVVQQNVDIFDDTLKENIIYANPLATDEQILEAIKASHLESFISDTERFPDGLDTQVGERGIRLSGGERQRVGIARAYIALLNGARFLILDEATSNLDSEAEIAIQQMIDKVRHKLNISILAIAHRLSTIKKADVIYVIEGGQVIESGDHNRLMQHNGLYSKLVEMQNLGKLRD